MYSKIQTAALVGIGTIPVTVEVDMSPGLPVFDMVGNISNQVREGKERIRTALHNLGILMPAKRITINLSPASVRKDSAAFDIPTFPAPILAFEDVLPFSCHNSGTS